MLTRSMDLLLENIGSILGVVAAVGGAVWGVVRLIWASSRRWTEGQRVLANLRSDVDSKADANEMVIRLAALATAQRHLPDGPALRAHIHALEKQVDDLSRRLDAFERRAHPQRATDDA